MVQTVFIPFQGLKKDDLLSEHSKDVVEALRRCPEDVVYQRIFRQNRAAQLSMQHNILPEAEWTKMEEVREICITFTNVIVPLELSLNNLCFQDTPYLQPYVDEVKAEKEEKATWEEKNPL